jgi:spore coat protein A
MLLPGASIPKFAEQLPVATTPAVPGITVVDATSAGTPDYNIHISEFQSQILPQVMPAGVCPAGTASWVWGYLTDADLPAGSIVRPSYLGPVVVAERGVPAYPSYFNELPLISNVQPFLPIDMTVDWANPESINCAPDAAGNYTNPLCGLLGGYTGAMPTATHIHGGEVAPAFDGGPDAWETSTGVTGIGFPGNTYTYPNGQQEATIWFHDHALGLTRLNVYAGLAGLYPIFDPANPPLAPLPKFPDYDIPLILQDRSFDTNSQIF